MNADPHTVPARSAATWLARLLVVAAIAGATLWVHLYEFTGLNTWDSAIFLTIGKLLQRGLFLYRDLWDNKPPGIYLYQSAVFAVLPVEVWSLRLADFVLYLAGAGAFYALCLAEARRPLALAATAVWLFFLHHPTFNVAGFYTEEYAAVFAGVSLAAAARYARAGGWWAVAASGVAAAVAVIFKTPAAACGLPAVIVLSGRRPLRALPLFAIAGAAPIALLLADFWWHGALADYLDSQLWHPLAHHRISQAGGAPLWPQLQELARRSWLRLGPYPALIVPAAAGVPVSLLRPTRLRLAMLVWLIGALVFVAAQRFYYEHYFIQVFPPLILVGLTGAAWLLQAVPGESLRIGLARLALCAVAVGVAWPPLRDLIAARQPAVAHAWGVLRAGRTAWPKNPGGPFELEIGRYLAERTAPDERIFVFQTGTAIAIYWTADRLPASRYIPANVIDERADRQREQVEELRRHVPAYIVVVGESANRHFAPLLREDYSLQTVLWRDYRAEIWGRRRRVAFAAGVFEDVVADAAAGGMALPSGARRGTWTSPVVEAAGQGGKIAIDWSPRADLIYNPTGAGLPAGVTTNTHPPDDVRALLGASIGSGRWSTFPRRDPQSVTVDLGRTAIADRVVIDTVPETPVAMPPPFAVLAGTGRAFEPIDGTWESPGPDRWVYRFAPRPLAALRVIVTPPAPNGAVGLRRLRLPNAGAGVTLRYRTGPTPDLDGAAWQAIADEEGLREVPVDRYVQLQAELWYDAAGLPPVLRSVQVGRVHFQPDGAVVERDLRARSAGRRLRVRARRPRPTQS